MSWLVVLPVAIPLMTAVAAFLVGSRRRAARVISTAGSALLLAASVALLWQVWTGGVVAATMGNWPAPFGIALVADHLSAVMVVVSGVIGLAVAVYALADVDRQREARGYHALYQVLLAGVCGAFVTGDLFNLYVWFEVMLIASFGLLVLGGTRRELDGGIRYVVLNLIATLTFLFGVAIIYGATGTLNLADLHLRLADHAGSLEVEAAAMLLALAFGMKAAVFPLFFWLPASYHTPAVSVSAIFAALLTKVGVYALIRVFTLVFSHDPDLTRTLFWAVAALTMIVGVLAAASQNEVRRILSFHIISQIGYMIIGLALLTPLALAGAVFYLVHHIIVKANLFLIAGVIRRQAGSFHLPHIGGLMSATPWLAVLFLIPALSLAGMPPFSGFWAKLLLIQASLEVSDYAMAAVALVVGLLTLYSMTKIWNEAFWKPSPDDTATAVFTRRDRRTLMLPIAALATITVVIGATVAPLLELSQRAAAELLDPSAYVTAVLGAMP